MKAERNEMHGIVGSLKKKGAEHVDRDGLDYREDRMRADVLRKILFLSVDPIEEALRGETDYKRCHGTPANTT